MNMTDISIWYYIVVLLLAGAMLGVFALIDRRTLRQALKTLGLLAAEVAGISLAVWFLGRQSHWWALTLVVTAVGGAYVFRAVREGMQTYHRSRLHTREHYEYLIGNGASQLEALMPSVRRSLRAVVVKPLRDWSRPLVATPLLLLLGLLLAGAQPIAAAIAALLFALCFIGLSVACTIAGIWIVEKRAARHSLKNA